MIDRIENTTAYCKCKCGADFTLELPPVGSDMRDINEMAASYRFCPSCEESHQRTQEHNPGKDDTARLLAENVEKAGIPIGYRLDAPPVRSVAEWLWCRREKSILLSGMTGTGKSTSACFVAIRLIERGVRVRYSSLRKLLSEWRDAKTGDAAAVDRFLARLASLDLLIIDEVVNKASISMSGQELLFELIDGVYCRERKCRIWLLGNFFTGAIAAIFEDPEPVKRRLRESFQCVRIEGEKITSIEF